MAETETIRDRLVDEVASVVSDAQDMLQRANSETAEKARALRSDVEAQLLRAKLRLQELQGKAVERTRAAAKVTDAYVRENPWQVLGAAALVGFLVGVAISRRD